MSFNIAISGLNATNQQLSTISNNIANVSTTGYKESRTEFAAIYNSDQVGGVEVSGITQNFDLDGSVESTGRALDLAISGNGFFATVDSNGQQLYSRSGAFSTDKDNFIVSNTGNKLQGYTFDADENIQLGNLRDLSVSESSLAAQATTTVDFVANFDARAEAIDPATKPFDSTDPTSFTSSYTTLGYDSLGNSHTISQYFINRSANTWDVAVVADGEEVDLASNVIEFNADGSLKTPTTPISVDMPITGSGANPMSVAIDLSGSTQYAANFGVSTNDPDGYTSGDLNGLRVEDNGMIFAQYSNGQSQLQGQVVLVDFPNPTALSQSNNTSWMQTFASGAPVTGAPGTGVLGSLTSGALEGSNVDLTGELVSLMTAQRNYQANTKIISTSDQLTQALFNAV